MGNQRNKQTTHKLPSLVAAPTSLLLFMIIVLAIGLITYRVKTIEHYKENLIALGVPLEFINQQEIKPTTQERANQIAVSYFTQALLQKGVSLPYIEQLQVLPSDQETANRIALDYFRTDLRNRGISESYIQELDTGPSTLEEADNIAAHYFTQELASRGIEESYIEQLGTRVLNLATADQTAITYFSEDLASRGIPRKYITNLETKPLDLNLTEQIAGEYFLQVLELRGVSGTFLEEVGIEPHNLSITDELHKIYLRSQAFDEERLALVVELEELESVLPQIESEEINQVKSIIATAIGQELIILEDRLNSQIEEELNLIANRVEERQREIAICTGITVIPVIGDAIDFLVGGLVGIDPCTGEELEPWERALNLFLIGEFVKFDNVVAFLRGLNRAEDFANAARAADRLDDIDALRDVAAGVGRGTAIDNLAALAYQTERNDDMRTVIIAVNVYATTNNVSSIGNVDDVIMAVRRLENSGKLQDLISSAQQLGLSNNLDLLAEAFRKLERTDNVEDLPELIRILEQSNDFDNIINRSQAAQRLGTLDVLSEIENILPNSTRAKELNILERIFNYSGLADNVEEGLNFLKRHEGLKIMIERSRYDDYIELVKDFTPDARHNSWEIWASKNLRGLREYSWVLRPLNSGITRIIEQEKTVWELYYYSQEDELSLQSNITLRLQDIEPLFEDGFTVNFVFSSRPSSRIMNEIENSGGNVYWGPENLP